MREQERLRTEMQRAYRMGNRKEAERILALLSKDEDEEKLKYLHKANKEVQYREKLSGVSTM